MQDSENFCQVFYDEWTMGEQINRDAKFFLYFEHMALGGVHTSLHACIDC